MNRTFVLLAGVVCWSLAAADAALHLVNGNVLVPVAMAVAGTLWIGLRTAQHRLRPVLAD